jgi:putative nucleotidyltransferase with HDIG domain
VNPLSRLARLAARTVRGLSPAWAHPDDAFAASWLVGPEYDAYQTMDPRDRDHACRVARRLLAAAPAADPIWVRAALLHDVGKAVGPYRVWARVGVHLWTPDAASARAYPAAWREAWARHRDHAALGAAALRAAGVDERVAALVERHHEPPGDDEALRWLATADEDA